MWWTMNILQLLVVEAFVTDEDVNHIEVLQLRLVHRTWAEFIHLDMVCGKFNKSCRRKLSEVFSSNSALKGGCFRFYAATFMVQVRYSAFRPVGLWKLGLGLKLRISMPELVGPLPYNLTWVSVMETILKFFYSVACVSREWVSFFPDIAVSLWIMADSNVLTTEELTFLDFRATHMFGDPLCIVYARSLLLSGRR
jgi:hypothetical protein